MTQSKPMIVFCDYSLERISKSAHDKLREDERLRVGEAICLRQCDYCPYQATALVRTDQDHIL